MDQRVNVAQLASFARDRIEAAYTDERMSDRLGTPVRVQVLPEHGVMPPRTGELFPSRPTLAPSLLVSIFPTDGSAGVFGALELQASELPDVVEVELEVDAFFDFLGELWSSRRGSA